MDLLWIVAWVAGLCLLGAAALRTLGVRPTGTLARITFAYWGGYGLYGAYLFFPVTLGVLNIPTVLLPFAAAPFGYAYFRTQWTRPSAPGAATLFLGLLTIAALLNLAGAWLPPTEVDSLAYHFTLPKRIAAAGAIEFRPYAVESAIPLLTHMLSTGAYVLWGERLLALNAWAASLFSALAVFVASRPWLGRSHAWLVAFLIYSVPAVTYGAVTGTVEPKLIGMTVVGTLALNRFRAGGARGDLILSAIMAGAIAGSKYFGLFTAASMGVMVLLLQRRSPLGVQASNAMLWGAFFLAIGGQWYAWNAVHTGDPVFPALYSVFGHSGWSEAMERIFTQHYVEKELMIPRNPITFFTYPFHLTVDGARFDSGRAGLGPLFLMTILPALLLFAGRIHRNGLRRIDTFTLFVGMFVLDYALFFFLGTSGRARHLLLVFPLILIPAYRIGLVLFAQGPATMRALARLALAGVVVIQLAAVGAANSFALSALVYRMPRDEYLRRLAPQYAAAAWLNENLRGGKVAFESFRGLDYFLEIPYFRAHPFYQEIIPIGYGGPEVVLEALEREHVTHWILIGDALEDDRDPISNQWRTLRALVNRGCFVEIHRFTIERRVSRTTKWLGSREIPYHVFEIVPDCSGVAAGGR